jgi:hypothetical protein
MASAAAPKKCARPFHLRLAACQPQPGVVSERGGLQGVAGGFAGHLAQGQAAEFPINQRQELISAEESPCSAACRMRVTSLMMASVAPDGPAATEKSAQWFRVRLHVDENEVTENVELIRRQESARGGHVYRRAALALWVVLGFKNLFHLSFLRAVLFRSQFVSFGIHRHHAVICRFHRLGQCRQFRPAQSPPQIQRHVPPRVAILVHCRERSHHTNRPPSRFTMAAPCPPSCPPSCRCANCIIVRCDPTSPLGRGA